jgi:hypothetical protein
MQKNTAIKQRLRYFILPLLALCFLVLATALVCRKRNVPLLSNGKVVATVHCPLVMPWKEGAYVVSVGKTNRFSMWTDFFDTPLLIYPFPGGQKFLCVDDDDTAILVFVVDFSTSAKSITNLPIWPSDLWTHNQFAQRITNVVMNTTGFVRLPQLAELLEVSSNVLQMSPSQYKKACIPCSDLGLVRGYWPKDQMMKALRVDRGYAWP